MAEAKVNETCIIGLPTCGYAFSGNRMVFIAAPSDDEFELELEILSSLLEEKEYDASIAVKNLEPGKFAFCKKICSKIITSQFCVVLLNSSAHIDHNEIKIPNPNVHLEYGMMLAFKKYIIPFQRKGEALPFNVQPLDTVIYTKGNFKEKATQAIDGGILAASTTARQTSDLVSNEVLTRYLAVRGLKFTDLNSSEATHLYRLGSFLGFSLLDGREIVYFGMFDREDEKEVIFRLKLLLQNIFQTIEKYESVTIKTATPEQIEVVQDMISRLRVEVLISEKSDKSKIESKVRELTQEWSNIPWLVVTEKDMKKTIDEEFGAIGEL
jgi:hypothetical protein